jgi:hypothetical protein
VLSWASLVRGLSQTFPQLYQAVGRPGYAVASQLLTGATLVLGFLLALAVASRENAALWVAWVWLLSYPIPLAAQFVMARRCASVRFSEMMRALWLPALGLGLMALALGAASLLRPHLPSPAASLVFVTAAGMLAYLVYLHGVMRLRWRDLLPDRAQ